MNILGFLDRKIAAAAIEIESTVDTKWQNVQRMADIHRRSLENIMREELRRINEENADIKQRLEKWNNELQRWQEALNAQENKLTKRWDEFLSEREQHDKERDEARQTQFAASERHNSSIETGLNTLVKLVEHLKENRA
jgi:hypothetical protein